MKRVIFAAALACTGAHAEFLTGNDLYQKLNGDFGDKMMTIGYIMGVFDATRSVEHCPPDNITAGQVRDMVRNHLEATPSTRHYTADVQVRYVLGKTWPCAKKGSSL